MDERVVVGQRYAKLDGHGGNDDVVQMYIESGMYVTSILVHIVLVDLGLV